MKAKIAQQIIGLAEYYDKTLTANQIEMFVEDLGGISFEQLQYAVKKYRTDPANVFFPLPAKLLGIVAANDGRPGTEEAWALCPKDEQKSAYLNDEIMLAFSSSNSILRETGDKVAARMAFKEIYEKTVKANRESGIIPKWWLSSGYDKHGREAALKEAIEKKRISPSAAQSLMPEVNFIPQVAIEFDNPDAKEIQKLISETMNKETV